MRCTVQYRSDATITLARTKLSSHECKYTRVQIISGQSVLNIYGGSHDQVLDIDFLSLNVGKTSLKRKRKTVGKASKAT